MARMMAGTASFQMSGGTRPGIVGQIKTASMATPATPTRPMASTSRKNTVHSDTMAMAPPSSQLSRRSSSRLS